MVTLTKSSVKRMVLGSAVVMSLADLTISEAALAQSGRRHSHKSAKTTEQRSTEPDRTTMPGWSPSWSYTNTGRAPYDYNNRYGTFGDQ